MHKNVKKNNLNTLDYKFSQRFRFKYRLLYTPEVYTVSGAKRLIGKSRWRRKVVNLWRPIHFRSTNESINGKKVHEATLLCFAKQISVGQ